MYKISFRTKNIELSPNFYDVLIIDIDGCLVDSTGDVSERSIDYINAVRKLGVTVILATGRSAYGAWPIAEKVGATGLHIVSHGACIASWPDKVNNVIASLEDTSIAALVRELNASQVSWAAFGERKIFCVQGAEVDLEKSLRARRDIVDDDVVVRPISDLDSWSWSNCGDISKIWCNVDISEAIKSKEVLKIDISGTQVSRTTNETIEFFSTSASKVFALEHILGEVRQGRSKVLVLGDHDNDIPVMTWADHALAPANASIAVRNLDSVDVFPVSNDEEFVAEALKSYYELRL